MNKSITNFIILNLAFISLFFCTATQASHYSKEDFLFDYNQTIKNLNSLGYTEIANALNKTSEPIEVPSLRSKVLAATWHHRETGEMKVFFADLTRFRDMSPEGRTFLLGHEGVHISSI